MTFRAISISIALVCSIWAFVPSAFGEVKVDPYFASIDSNSAGQSIGAEVKGDDISPMVDIFILAQDAEAAKLDIERLGGVVGIVSGDIVTATIASNRVAELSESEAISYIEAAKALSTKDAAADEDIALQDVHRGVNLPTSYTGEGAIVGIVDTGIDYTHSDFLGGDGSSRIIAIWDQTDVRGPVPYGNVPKYGSECGLKTISDGSCAASDAQGHGTHIAGIAAGRNWEFNGVAPDSDIIAVVYDSSVNFNNGAVDAIFATKICEAIHYVFERANSIGRPAVVNLSLGTHIGPHDGRSLFERCLSNLVRGRPGRMIVAAAGNEYQSDIWYGGIHAGGDVDGSAAANFDIRFNTKEKIYYIDLWGDSSSDLAAGLKIHYGKSAYDTTESSRLASPGEVVNGSLAGGKISYVINASETKSLLNGKQHIGIEIRLNGAISNIANYTFDIILEGQGRFDAWLFPDRDARGRPILFTNVSGEDLNGRNFIPGDSIMTISIPATSPDVIAVGGYAVRNSWDGGDDCCSVVMPLGELLSFSSSGPTPSPDLTGMKPEIAAPGGMIAAALSHDYSPSSPEAILPDGKHFLQAGTSMSTPFVTGVAALIFSANPNFTSEDVRMFIVDGASAVDGISDLPDDRWGYGRLNAFASLNLALGGEPSGDFDMSRNSDDGMNFLEASGGCSLTIAEREQKRSAPTCILILLAPITMMRIYRNRFEYVKYLS